MHFIPGQTHPVVSDQFFIVFRSFSSDSITVVFYRAVNDQIFDFPAIFWLFLAAYDASENDPNTIATKRAKYDPFTTHVQPPFCWTWDSSWDIIIQAFNDGRMYPEQTIRQWDQRRLILHQIMHDLARFCTNPTENRNLRNLTQILIIRFLKDLSVSLDLMIWL